LTNTEAPRAATSPCIPRPSWTRSPPNSTTGPANGSDSANRSSRSLTCFWRCEDHPAQPLAPNNTSASFLIAASPDAAPEESRWSPHSRAAARRNDLDADQRQPTIRRRGRSRTRSAEPSQGSSGNATHASFSHRGTITGSRACCDHRQNPPVGLWHGHISLPRQLRRCLKLVGDLGVCRAHYEWMPTSCVQ
jgi:hypothetical protein